MTTNVEYINDEAVISKKIEEPARYLESSFTSELIKEWSIKEQDVNNSGAYCGCRCIC